MMHTFYKYQGTGNDFVIIDNRQDIFDKNNTKLIKRLCDRRFGIGADGLILLENHNSADFKMVYYNADGNESTMCGNGGRCIVAFAKYLGIVKAEATFEAVDGLHKAIIEDGLVKLQMHNVQGIQMNDDFVFLDTGSPHHVQFQENLKHLDIKTEGSTIRFSNLYKKEGVNVNFVEAIDTDNYSVRTYERGVEDETLSCGTGVTAVAIAMHYIGETEKNLITLLTPGGSLKVSFDENKGAYNNVWLIGPAEFVYKGEVSW
ncbi:diaminopimelate epimerase [Yeosuana sp. MJ-SS3]|uniref:Diaminopimelate epimerase n=1 Tax=Gilvirhabdus luticola TaxID=3079858 RepID=A0ABU3UAA9_9FLAO|nr:diaminopimelate epimerase [Yeosuana sp. MJ-SS3]MDU8887330.1 diaminopimelate epimerase [Yeosuana sp. MJ-SS3]